MLKLTFLGTSAGVPTKARNVTALAIECLNPHSRQKSQPWLLIDCGEGTQQQLLHTKLSLHQLAAICITHVHGDHCYGLPGLLASAAMSGRSAALTIIAPSNIATLLEAITQTTQLHLPFAVQFIAIEALLTQKNGKTSIDITPQHSLDIDITKLSHRVPSHAFGITQIIHQRTLDTDKLIKDDIPASALWGQLQQGEDVTLANGRTLYASDYVIDAQKRTRIVVAGDNDAPALLSDAVQEADALIHEATYTSDVQARILAKNPDFNPMHSSAAQVGKFAQTVGLKDIILTHFSARYQSFDNPDSDTPNMAHIRTEATGVYDGRLYLAADFAQYMIDGASDGAPVQDLGSVI